MTFQDLIEFSVKRARWTLSIPLICALIAYSVSIYSPNTKSVFTLISSEVLTSKELVENLRSKNEQLNFLLDFQGVEYKKLLIVPESLQINLLGLEDKVDENKIVDLLLTHLQGVIREDLQRKLKDHLNNENQSANCLVCSIFI